MLSLGCDATTCDHHHTVQAVCYTNELAAGYKIHVIHLLMMLARFGAAGLLTDQQSTCCLGCAQQRAIINIAVQAVCYTNELAGVQNSCNTLFDDAGKICAAGLLTDKQSTCCLGCDATTCDHQHRQCRQCVTQINQQQGYKIHVIHSLMMLARFCAAGSTDQQSTCCLSAVTPQRAIINIDSGAAQMN
jgi:hypothetical protein